MIFDRTAQDVSDAIKIRTEKAQTGQALTEDELITISRGLISIDTLNRIEEKQAELVDIFTTLGYYNIGVVNKSWEYEDIFTGEDFHRIVRNLNILRQAFFVYSNTPQTPEARYYFQNINDIEKILYDLEEIAADLPSYYRECGTFDCGEDNLL